MYSTAIEYGVQSTNIEHTVLITLELIKFVQSHYLIKYVDSLLASEMQASVMLSLSGTVTCVQHSYYLMYL